jgi:hypothetical protein
MSTLNNKLKNELLSTSLELSYIITDEVFDKHLSLVIKYKDNGFKKLKLNDEDLVKEVLEKIVQFAICGDTKQRHFCADTLLRTIKAYEKQTQKTE